MAFVNGCGVVPSTKAIAGGNVCARSAFHGAQVAVAKAPVAKASINMEVTINIEDGENIEGALRRFKREVLKSGHLMELRRRKTFENNTEKRLRRDAMSRKRQRMAKNARER